VQFRQPAGIPAKIAYFLDERPYCSLLTCAQLLEKSGVFLFAGNRFSFLPATGENAAMRLSTPRHPAATSLFDSLPDDLARQLAPYVKQLAQAVESFRSQSPTPPRTHQFENDLAVHLRGLGQVVVEWTFNHLEADDPGDVPTQLLWQGQAYQRRPKSRNRSLQGLFGPIRLQRYRYEPIDGGDRSLFPLELALGIEAERATPALAERAAHAAASQTQGQVRALLVQQHGVHWSVKALRKVTASVSQGLAEHRQAAQAARLVQALQQAEASAGAHRPTVCVGRDGVMVPLRGRQDYAEASAATVSVRDRQGRRLYTAYLGRMPEKEQKTLSQQLTSLLLLLPSLWTGVSPRWQYLSDGGHQPTAYFRQVLRRLRDPRTGRRWSWEWVIDFYHASAYVTKLAEALFGGTRAGLAWAAKMRHWLRHKPGGLQRVLYSAAALRARYELTTAEEKAYDQAWGYLQKRKRRMDYAGYKRRGLAVGSGVTEAACKTVFAQRLKQSGMRWQVAGGQVIVDLRVLVLSRVWDEAYQAYLLSKPQSARGTLAALGTRTAKKAA